MKIAETIYTSFQRVKFGPVLTMFCNLRTFFSEEISWYQLNNWKKSSLTDDIFKCNNINQTTSKLQTSKPNKYLLLFFQVNNLSLCNSEHFASCADDGSVRVWSLESREQTLQFQVKDQVFIHCTELVYLSDHQGIERNILSKPI
jgi:WD40 repeat protein